jgi:superoxide dismutase, Fe-Mn family
MLLTKREFCKAFAAASALSMTGGTLFAAEPKPKEDTMTAATQMKDSPMPITLPPLPYEQNALEPYITANTLSFHHGKHHNAYVTNLNNLIKDSPLANATLEQIILDSAKDPAKAGIFNNAAQVWNHTFYWNSMKPNGGGAPKGELAKKIESDLGGFDAFKEAFKQAATTQFGSGWAWLVLDGGKLKITKTGNAGTPMVHGQKALITIDVWEHAYYLDFQNRRPDYITTFLDKLVNWDFAEANLKG